MRGFYSYLTFWATVVLFPVISYAGIFNGGFEMIDPNSPAEFNAPAFWERENYAAVMERFIPDPESGNSDQWSIDLIKGLLPIEGDKLVVISNGGRDTDFGSISQEVFVFPGMSISGYYFFGTCDYIPYIDYATIELIPIDSNPGPNDITLVYIDVNDVDDDPDPEEDDGKSMAGWAYFEYEFAPDEGGGYDIVISVFDSQDNYFESYLAVDGIKLCENKPQSDINNDCYVNMLDFSRFATDWLEDCNDPNYLADPNNNCFMGTDLDENGLVDVNDLMSITAEWLDGDE